MDIYTDLVRNRHFDGSINSELLKYSQEYRTLATLRYLYPGKYEAMELKDSPDLQDCDNGIGIEVTTAVRTNDMKATSAFARLGQAASAQEVKKFNKRILESGHSLRITPWGKSLLSPSGTSNGEKNCFQKAIQNKKAKFQKYKTTFDIVGLAVLFLSPPTSEAERNIVDWIRGECRFDDNSFDFIYVISHRFCLYYDSQTDYFQKLALSKEEDSLLRTVGRMTAEGELSLTDREWR